MENLPNDNIFKNDMRYKILKDISFEMVIDEESAVKDLTERHNYLATQAIPIFMLIYITDISMKTYFELFLSLVSLSLIALYIFLILDKKTEKKLIISDITRNYFYKCILEIILSNKIILSTPSDDLLLNDLIYYLLPSFFYSLSFEINIIHSIMFNFFKVNLVLVKYGNNSSDVSLTVRIITSIFSTNFFLAYFMIFWAAFVEYFIKKAIRELWALYDSFKRSYFTIKKCLMDDHPIPSIIVTNKRPNFLILYKNKQAEELFSKSPVLKSKEISDSYFKKSQNFKKEIRASPSNTSSIVNLEDIFTNEMESSFSAEIEKCISNRKRYFDFPLKIIEKSPKWVVKQVEGKRTFFKGDLSKYEWFRVVVSPCNWKNQEAIFIQLIKNEEFQANEFITGYISNINDQMNLLVGNSELVCNKVVEYEYEKSKEKCSNDQKYLKNSIDCIIMKSSPRMHEGSQKKTPESQLQSINSNKMKAPSLKKVLNVNQTMSIKNNIIFPFPKFDHSLWLFFKYNTNFVYDMNLTVQLYYAFINKKIFPPTEKIKIKEFLNYLIDYFYLISQVKNFKFVIKNLSNDEIIISYVYFRAILFNILLFILNNSNSNEEKIVEINIKNEKNFESKQDMFNFHFEIKYYDNKIKINYDTLRKILAIENLHNLIEIDKDIAKIKCIDLGMVLTNYIINYVYDNNLLLLSYGANHSISFYVKGYLHKSYYIKLASTGINYSTIKLSEPRSRLFEQYQNKILQKLYKINPTAAVKIEGVREKLWKLENREMKRTFSFNTKTPNDSDENQEICNLLFYL